MNLLGAVKSLFADARVGGSGIAAGIKAMSDGGPGFSGSGVYYNGLQVSEVTAMRCSAVLACIRTICEDVSTLPACVKRKTPNGWTDVPDHPVSRLLSRDPNPYQTPAELIQHCIMDSLLAGHFAVYVQRDGNGRVRSLWPLQAGLLTLIKPVVFSGFTDDTELTFLYGGPEYPQRQFSSRDLWRGTLLPLPYLTDPSLGQYAITVLAREAIGLALAAERQGSRLFTNALQTDTAITSEESLDKEDRDRIHDYFRRKAGVNKSFTPLILEGGLKMERIAITPQEAMFIESRNFQLADIARIFRVPMVKLGVMENVSTYGAAEQQALEYVKSCILPWTHRIEQTAQRDLFTESEASLYLKHDLTHLLKADQMTRYKCWQLGISSGFLCPNDARVFEGMDKQPGLDSFVTPSTVQPAAAKPDTATLPDMAGLIRSDDGVWTKPNGHVSGKLKFT